MPALAFDKEAIEIILTLAPFYAPLILAPLCIGIAWRLWGRPEQLIAKKWRSRILLAGLLAGSGNVIIYYACLIYRLFAGFTPNALRIHELCAEVGISSSLVVLGAAF